MKKFLFILLIIIAMLGCVQSGIFNNTGNSKGNTTSDVKYGSLVIKNIDNDKPTNIDPTRSIVISDIKTAMVTVSGWGMNDIAESAAVVSGAGEIRIENIPVGKNRVISVQARTDSGDMTGIVMRGIKDIVSGDNTVDIRWSSTPLGETFYELLYTHDYNIGSMSDATRDAISSIITGTTVDHPSLFNSKNLAEDVANWTLKSANDASYKITPASAVFSINGITVFTGFTAQVNDPASGKLTTLTTGENTITGIKPGNWELIISLDGGVVYRSGAVTIQSGTPYNFGSIDLLVADPYFLPVNTTFATSLDVTIDISTTGASIYYTTDGTDPDASDDLYSGQININTDTTFKARAYKTNYIPSDVVTKTYTKIISSTIGENHPSSGAFSPIDLNGGEAGFGWSTQSWALGSHFVGTDVTFAVYSKNATKVLLEIYETETSSTNTNKAYGTDARYDYWMEKGSDNIWRAKITAVPEKTYYAYRVWGSNWTFNSSWTRGNSAEGFVSDVDDNGRFNPNKVVFDPYTREISHDKEFPAMAAAGENGGMYGTSGTNNNSTHTYSGPTTTGGVSIDRRNVDTGRWVPKGIILKPTGDTFNKPTFAQEASVIYEAHVRGITAHSSTSNLTDILDGIEGFSTVVDVPSQYRGTYKGVAYLAKYLKAIGINTIELLPVHETENDMLPFDGSQPTLGGAKNFWGYMTYGFFAPDRRYSSDKSAGGPTAEFQDMVQALNAEGIKIFLDVVFNHTGEGGNWGDMNVTGFVSMGGLDCAEYYHLVPGGTGKNWLVDGATGCGNQLNFSKNVNHNLILDSLTYWIDTMGISGYRFDLAAVIGRKPDDHAWEPSDTYWDRVKAFYTDHPTLTAMATLATNKSAWMIAEAWDMWGYPVGMFPNGWGEWNGRYRDCVRKYMYGNAEGYDGVSVQDAFYGDWNHFNDQGGPHKSINFLVAHDGFTLTDLVSYNSKMNSTLTWPFGPSDGGGDSNLSWDSNGDQTLRRQRLRNFWTFQMFSRGTPMVVYGDELARTQNGNNNPYNIDSIMTWNNYNMIDSDAPHSESTESSSGYHNNIGTDGKLDNSNNIFLFSTNLMKLRRDTSALHANNYDEGIGYASETGGTLSSGARAIRIWRGDFLICSNMWTETVNFTLPTLDSGYSWVRIVDTASWAESDNNYWDVEDGAVISGTYGVNAWSIAVFKKASVVETPVIKPTQGFSVTFTITATCATSGATIRYTLDGTEPTETSSPFGSDIIIDATTTFKAKAFYSGMRSSNTATAVYSNTSKVEKPVLSLDSSNFWNEVTIFAFTDTTGDTIYYTLDDSDPTTGDTEFPSTGVTINATDTIKVKAFKTGLTPSDTVSATYTKKGNGTYTEDPYGVMLQGFHWDSASDSKNWYTTVSGNKADIKANFEYIWLPPPSSTPSFSKQGYIPTALNDLNSYYGSATELKQLITDLSPDTKAIADIVVNHRGGTSGWGDFENPRWEEDYASITSGDEGFTDVNSDMYGWTGPKGVADTGANYSAARDLDHSGANVQKGIETWMNSVLKDAGFVGWRYDYVKGFNGDYVGQYNTNTSAAFSVGEYWPTAGFDTTVWANALNGWVSATNTGGMRSRVFDFVLKGNLNYAFGYFAAPSEDKTDTYWNMALLAHGSNIFATNPADAVTFVDNHDTGSSQRHWELDADDVPLAYTYILTHPGYPSVAYQHYFNSTTVSGTSKTLKQHIEYLIALRKRIGIRYDASITNKAATTTNYAAKITGSGGKEIIVKIGGDSWSPTDEGYIGNSPIYFGTNFAIWEKGVAGPKFNFYIKVPTWANNAQPVITYNGNGTNVTNSDAFTKVNDALAWDDPSQWAKLTTTVSDPNGTIYFTFKFWEGSVENQIYAAVNGTDWFTETTATGNIFVDCTSPTFISGTGPKKFWIDPTTKVTEKSPYAGLDSLTISSGTLSPTFSRTTDSYTATVANDVTSITFTPTATFATDSIIKLYRTTDGTIDVISGNVSDSRSLDVGANTFTLTCEVTDDSSITEVYTIVVTRQDVSGYSNTITLDGTSSDWDSAKEKFTISDSKELYVTWDTDNIYFAFNSEAMNVDNKVFYVALNTYDTSTDGSYEIPYEINYTGSKVTTPVKVKYVFFFKWLTSMNKYKLVYDSGAWGSRTTTTETSEYSTGTFSEYKIPRSAIGNPNGKFYVMTYAKDLVGGSSGGWGYLFGSSPQDSVTGGTNDKILGRYYEFDLSTITAPTSQDCIKIAPTVNTPTFTYTKKSGNGTYQPQQLDLTMDCVLSGATIYYTTDGSTPTTSSSTYSGSSIKVGSADYVGNSYTIKCFAFKFGYTPSSIASITLYKTVLNVNNEDTWGTMLNFKGSTSPLEYTTSTGTGNAINIPTNNWYWITWELESSFNFNYLRRDGAGGGAWCNGSAIAGTIGATNTISNLGFQTWSASGF